MPLTSKQPYLIRAIYDWMLDNHLTPHVLIDATGADVIVPRQFVEDGKIVLNIAPRAVQNLQLGNEQLQFNARFSGSPMQVSVPVSAVMAIYAKENGQGMVFQESRVPPDTPPDASPNKPARPSLKVVK